METGLGKSHTLLQMLTEQNTLLLSEKELVRVHFNLYLICGNNVQHYFNPVFLRQMGPTWKFR